MGEPREEEKKEEEEKEEEKVPAIDIEELKKSIVEEIKPLLKKEEEEIPEEIPDLKSLLEEREEFSEADLESMPRAKFLEYVIDKAEKKILSEAIKPLEQRLAEVSQAVVESKIQEAISQAAAKYPDFWDYKDEMLALSEQYPQLSPEHLYLLVKGGKAPLKKKEEPKPKKRIEAPVPSGGKERQYGSWEDAAKDVWASLEKETE